MTAGFLVWRPGLMKDGICKLEGLSGVEDSEVIDEGTSRLDGWPAGASATMDARFAKDRGLADSLFGAGYLVVSAAVRALLDKEKVAPIEYLRIRILDLDGGVASSDYFVVNPLAIVDCIDQKASGVELDPFGGDGISGCERLVLDEKAIPAELQILRPKFWPARILVRRALADKMVEAGFTCLRLIEPARYNGLV